MFQNSSVSLHAHTRGRCVCVCVCACVASWQGGREEEEEGECLCAPRGCTRLPGALLRQSGGRSVLACALAARGTREQMKRDTKRTSSSKAAGPRARSVPRARRVVLRARGAPLGGVGGRRRFLMGGNEETPSSFVSGDGKRIVVRGGSRGVAIVKHAAKRPSCPRPARTVLCSPLGLRHGGWRWPRFPRRTRRSQFVRLPLFDDQSVTGTFVRPAAAAERHCYR